MNTVKETFKDNIFPFMESGRWWTAEQLKREIPRKYQLGFNVSKVLSQIYSSSLWLERKDRRLINFPRGATNHGRWAYRIARTKEVKKIEVAKYQQLELDLYTGITVHDVT